jgi:hypothetical protein
MAHHMFPHKFAENFKNLGINIWDVNNATWWENTSHLRAAREYNLKWQDWFRDNPNATAADASAFAKDLAEEYNLNWP